MTLLSAVAKKTRKTMFAETIPIMHRTYCDHQPDVKQNDDQRRRGYEDFARQLRDVVNVYHGTIPRLERPSPSPLVESISLQ